MLYNELMALLNAYEKTAKEVTRAEGSPLTSLDFYFMVAELNQLKLDIHNPDEADLSKVEFRNLLTRINSLLIVLQSVINDKLAVLDSFRRLVKDSINEELYAELIKEAKANKMHVKYESKKNRKGELINI